MKKERGREFMSLDRIRKKREKIKRRDFICCMAG